MQSVLTNLYKGELWGTTQNSWKLRWTAPSAPTNSLKARQIPQVKPSHEKPKLLFNFNKPDTPFFCAGSNEPTLPQTGGSGLPGRNLPMTPEPNLNATPELQVKNFIDGRCQILGAEVCPVLTSINGPSPRLLQGV